MNIIEPLGILLHQHCKAILIILHTKNGIMKFIDDTESLTIPPVLAAVGAVFDGVYTVKMRLEIQHRTITCKYTTTLFNPSHYISTNASIIIELV